MDYQNAITLWQQIRSSRLDALRRDFVELAVRYARLRVDYLLAASESQRLLDQDRTACHNALIASCDILARNMAKSNEDASWRVQLGDERKTIGDFACHLHAILGISAR